MSFDENNPPHVQFILLAEFDIGKGASLTHQYPYKTGMDEHVLAEMMLPDGVHQRAEDWTIFFLNPNRTYGAHRSPYNENEVEPKQLLYGLSLVTTKYDSEAVRGAHVKSMAICTKHRYLHIYKPVLLLALENYFRTSEISVLVSLYNAVNSMDDSLMPKFNIYEKMILRASEDREMFEEKFLKMEEELIILKEYQQMTLIDNNNNNNNNVNNNCKLKRQTFIDLSSGQKKDMNNNNKHKDRHFFETVLTYEKVNIPIRVPLTIYPEEVGDFSMINLIATFANAPINPHTYHPHLDTSGQHTHPIIFLMNALLTEKRVIFLGHGLTSGKVANYVLAACAMASGSGIVLKGFLERAFPYTSLSDIESLLKFRGFIAGVANPTFEGHPKWWDVLCNISTKKITVSPYLTSTLDQNSSNTNLTFMDSLNLTNPSSSSEVDGDIINQHRRTSTSTSITNQSSLSSPGSITNEKNKLNEINNNGNRVDNLDNEFMAEVMHSIHSHYGELMIRAKFADYVQRFVDLGTLYEDETLALSTHQTGLIFPDSATKYREITGNTSRIEGWKRTRSYKYYLQDKERREVGKKIKEMDVGYHISKLRILKSIDDEELKGTYKALLDCVVSDEQIIEFLASMPQNQGGLTPVTVALFHPNKIIRNYTVQFLNRLDQHQTGTRFIQNLNLFHKLAYERQCLAFDINDDDFKNLEPYLIDP